jgi:hypothetical protein
MTTLFNMKINLAKDTLINSVRPELVEGLSSKSDFHYIFHYIHLVFIALLVFSLSFNAFADTLQDKPAAIQSATEVDDLNEQEKARQRQSIAEAVRNEKLKMKTDVRDLKNKKRAAGEILGFDIFLGAFLTGLWAMISMFIAAQFSGAKNDRRNNDKNNNRKTDVILFYVSASFMPLMLLWVAVTTGYASWWLTLAVSGLIYWLLGLLFRKLKKSTPE